MRARARESFAGLVRILRCKDPTTSGNSHLLKGVSLGVRSEHMGLFAPIADQAVSIQSRDSELNVNRKPGASDYGETGAVTAFCSRVIAVPA